MTRPKELAQPARVLACATLLRLFAPKNLNLNLRRRSTVRPFSICIRTAIYTRKPREQALIAAAIAYHEAMDE